MIPKIIHYCWFGGKVKPQSVQRNIEIWHQKLPDYEIKEWNESNFDINFNSFTKEAYESKKYAFVSDIARLYALVKEGGIYLDTDVEVLRSFDDLLDRDYFFGREYSGVIGTATMGAAKENPIIEGFLDTYRDRHYINEDGIQNTIPNVVHLTEYIEKNYPEAEVLDRYYFSPKHPATRICETKRYTYCIHHFDGTWLDEEMLDKRNREGKAQRRRDLRDKLLGYFVNVEALKCLYWKLRK